MPSIPTPQVSDHTMERYFGSPPYNLPQFVAGKILDNLEARSLGLDHFDDEEILLGIGAEAALVVAKSYDHQSKVDRS